MSSHGGARRTPKRRRTIPIKSSSQLPDLNGPPAEGGSPSSIMAVVNNQPSSSSMPPAAGTRIGMHSLPIDVEVIDDDVAIYPSSSLPQSGVAQQSTRAERSVIVIIDDNPETTQEPAGDALDEHVNTLLSLGVNRRHELPRVHANRPVIDLLDTPEVNRLNNIKAPPEPVKEVPKELKFTCPVCMNELTDASSTICGHIFCQKCIRAAIQAQKKCPTCRRKLNMNNHHRVYLPTTE